MIAKGDTPFHETRPGQKSVSPPKFGNLRALPALLVLKLAGSPLWERPAVIESDIVLVFVEDPQPSSGSFPTNDSR